MIATESSAVMDQVEAIGMGQCPLVLGECIQGQTRERRHFLITAPIGLFSWAEFVRRYDDQTLVVEPAGCWKAELAVRTYLAEQGLPELGTLRINTPIASGQGFGTSTADITASVRAAAVAWRRPVSPEVIARIAIDIEPSDGSMYPGCVAFAHREGLLIEHLGSLPNFESLVICTGGTVDTMEFDGRRKNFRYSARDENELMAAWAMIRHANHLGDTALLGQAATISARINEQLLPKPYFKEVLAFTELGGAEGVMVAHSGTALALILDPVRSDHPVRMAEALDFLSSLRPPSWFQVSSRTVSQNIALQTPRRRPAMFQS